MNSNGSKTKEEMRQLGAIGRTVPRKTQRLKDAFYNIEVLKMPGSRGLIEAKYSPATAKNPKQILQSPSYNALREDYRRTLEERGLNKDKFVEVFKEILEKGNSEVKLKTIQHLESHLGLDKEIKKPNLGNSPVQVVIVAPTTKEKPLQYKTITEEENEVSDNKDCAT